MASFPTHKAHAVWTVLLAALLLFFMCATVFNKRLIGILAPSKITPPSHTNITVPNENPAAPENRNAASSPLILPGTFVYLAMSASEPAPAHWQRSCLPNSMLIFLAYKTRSKAPPPKNCSFKAVFYPHTTWAEGRNALRNEARTAEVKQGWKFEFYVFMDNDVCLKNRNATLTIDPDKHLQQLLLRDRPMRAAISAFGLFPLPPLDKNRLDCARACFTDAVVDAYHRTAVDQVLPYDTNFDAMAWCMSAYTMNLKLAAIAPQYCFLYRQLETDNKCVEHSNYPRVNGGLDTVPEWAQVRVAFNNKVLARNNLTGFKEGATAAEVNRKLRLGLFGKPGTACVAQRPGVDYGKLVRHLVT